MGGQVEKTPEARWRHLREVGLQTKVDLSTLEPSKPKWLDEDRFARAREAIQKYYLGVNFSSFTGLLMILQLPDGLEPLLSTGNSRDIPALYKRYLNTILHVRSWYQTDVFDPQSKGYRSIRQVRAMHRRVQGLMNDKFSVADVQGKARKWFTQYEVASTQFSFIGLALLFPQKCGLIGASEEDLLLLNYYWRVLGHLMGLEEEFNLCQFDTYQEVRQFYGLVFQHEFKEPLSAQPCQKGLEMTQAICLALSYYLPLVTFNGLANWWRDEFSFNGYQVQPLSIKEKVVDYWQRVSFNRIFKSERWLAILTRLHRERFEKRVKNKDKVYEKLRAQYQESSKYTFHSDRVDYFAKDKASPFDPSDPLVMADKQPGGELVAGERLAANHNDQDDDNNNNNNIGHKIDSKLGKKSLLEVGGCPFGYGAQATSTVAPVSA